MKFSALLHKLEKLLKIDVRYVLSGGFWLTFGQVVSAITGLALSIIFARLLPKETYGNYKFITSIFGMIAITSIPGLGAAVTQAVVKKHDNTIYTAIKTRIRWGLLGALASIGTAIYFYAKSNIDFAIIFGAAALFLPFMDSLNTYDCLLQGRKDFKKSNILYSIGQLIVLAAIAATVVVTKNIVWITISYIASWTLVRGAFFLYIKKDINKDSSSDASAITYGKHLSLMSVLATLTGQLDKVLAFHFLGAAQMAIYAFAIALPEQVRVILANINTLLFPKFVQHDDRVIHGAMRNKFIKLFIFSSAIVGCYIISAPFVFKILFPKYLDSVRYSQVFALSMLNLTFTPATVYLQAKKKVKHMYIGNIITPLFQITTMVVGIIWYGLMGLIIARVLTRFFGSLFNLFLYQKSKDIDMTEQSAQSI